jgi:PIN domain nuclease of toxin-antitoxin system
VAGDARLSRRARWTLEDPRCEPYLSAASVWEMAIKVALGRLRLPAPVPDYVEAKLRAGFRALPIEWPHAAAVASLQRHHRDPFDRLLVAQALLEGLPLLTGDPAFGPYPVKTVW